jgi:chromosome segregation ATPase
MQLPELNTKTFAKLKFAGFFSMAVILCIIIFSSFWVPGAAVPTKEPREVIGKDALEASELLPIAQMLHSKWMQLELMYNQHAMLLAEPVKNKDKQAGRRIMEAEVLYAKMLDSVSANNANTAFVEKVDSIVNSFRVTLQNRQALNTNISELALKISSKPTGIAVTDKKTSDPKLDELQHELNAKTEIISKLQNEAKDASIVKNNLATNEQKVLKLQNDVQAKSDLITKLQASAVAARNNSGNSNEQKLLQMQSDLQAKTDLISKFQSQLKSAPVKSINSGTDDQKIRELQKDIQSKNAAIAKLQSQIKAVGKEVVSSPKDTKKPEDELEFLKWALRSEVSSNHTLTNSVNQLKQANANLANQLKGK